MKTSTEILSCARIVGEERAVEYTAKAGFDAWDFSMFDMCRLDKATGIVRETDHPLAGSGYLKFARTLRRIGEDNGIVCNQSHAPFPTSHPQIRSYLQRAIECTAEAGGEICVIHPWNLGNASENAEFFLELLPFAKQHRVKIATENMFNWDRFNDRSFRAACAWPEDFLAHLDAVDDEYLVACLDIGHAEMRPHDTSAVAMIEALGSRLQALHIHDNDRRHDSHQIPFSMQIDFAQVVQALQRIGYSGCLTLEANEYLKDYTEENLLEGMQALSAAARRLDRMFL